MPVDVRLPTVLRPAAGGQATIQAEGATVGEIFDDLIRQLRTLGAVSRSETRT